jgi:hypothetical protein
MLAAFDGADIVLPVMPEAQAPFLVALVLADEGGHRDEDAQLTEVPADPLVEGVIRAGTGQAEDVVQEVAEHDVRFRSMSDYLRAIAITTRAIVLYVCGSISEAEARRRVHEAHVMIGVECDY